MGVASNTLTSNLRRTQTLLDSVSLELLLPHSFSPICSPDPFILSLRLLSVRVNELFFSVVNRFVAPLLFRSQALLSLRLSMVAIVLVNEMVDPHLCEARVF